MLRITELRIGNLVSVLNKDEARVVTSLNVQKVRDGFYKTIGFGIDKDGFADSYLEELIYPIPLTEEWLLKFDFSVRDSSTCKQWYIGFNEISNDWLFDLTWLESPELINAPNAPFYRNGRHTIFYVHQLQNLFYCLTGEEL